MTSILSRSKLCGGLARWQLLRVQSEIDTHLSESISNRQLAESVWLSPFHFARAFRRTTGTSPQSYVRQRRLERAKHLMLSTGATLCEISSQCGFADQSHLSRLFNAALGVTPSDWRKARAISPAPRPRRRVGWAELQNPGTTRPARNIALQE